MKRRRNSILMLTAVPLIAIGLAACGGSSNSSTSSSSPSSNTAAAASTSGATVSTMSISGVGTVLVDSNGDALYTNNQDTASKVACTGSCMSIWPALMAPSSGKPTSDNSSVQAKLGVVNSGGGSQVTYNGKPLYTFVQDSPGQATGNGFMDSFGGTNFTWTAATTSGNASSSGGSTSTAAPAAGGTSSSGRSASQSSGGYGY